jgi:hypothetical protein
MYTRSKKSQPKAAGGGIFSGVFEQGRQGTSQGQEDFELSWYLFFQHTYLNYRQLLHHPKYKDAWAKSAANEFGRLAQGLKDGRVKGTDTIKFIHKDQVPAERIKD